MSAADMSEIEDLPKGGPLGKYRQKASFDWKKMKLFFEDLDLIKYKVLRYIDNLFFVIFN